MTIPITVVIPVGPTPEACAYLPAAIESVAAQTSRAGLLIVDDMHGQSSHQGCVLDIGDIEYLYGDLEIDIVQNPWHGGVAFSFNHGVAQAWGEHVLMLGADDWLEPNAIALAQRAIAERNIGQGYYFYRVRYSDDRPERDQDQPCNAAVVTKALWRATGGFPVESALGRPDVMFIGMLMGHPDLGTLVPIRDDGTPPYNVRVHDQQHTASRGPWVRALDEAAQAYWTTYQPTRWGRYE